MKIKSIFKAISTLTVALGIGLVLTGCGQQQKKSHVGDFERIASNGSFVVGKNGVMSKTKSVKNKPVVDIYQDPLCPSCGMFDRATNKYLSQQVNAGKIVLRYHTMMFLDQGSTDDYSSRASAYVLGTAEYAPKLTQKFITALYEKTFQPKEGEDYKPVSNQKIQALFLGVGGTKQQAAQINKHLKKFGNISYKLTLKAMKDKDLISKSPTGELYTPFVIPNKAGQNDGKALEITSNMLTDTKKAVQEITK